MSYELQVAAEAKKLVEELKDRVALIEEHLGDELKALVAKHEEEKAAAAVASQPLELSPEEKQAILAARLQIASATAAKNTPTTDKTQSTEKT